MMYRQLTNTVVMVSPIHFGFNPQTANTNPFQHTVSGTEIEVQSKAIKEFNCMVTKLREAKIKVLILPSREDILTPDSLFPNNWFSHHQDGKLVVYPMLAENRRAERQLEKLKQLLHISHIPVVEVVDLTNDEKNGQFLEGTGSLVLDRQHKIAFAMASPRTIQHEFDKWCKRMEYTGVFFMHTMQTIFQFITPM